MTKELSKRAPGKTFFIPLEGQHTLRLIKGANAVFTCDIRFFLESLMDHTNEFRRPADADLQTKITNYKEIFQRGLKSHIAHFKNNQHLHFGLALKELAKQLDENVLVVAGMGNHRYWGRILLPMRGREGFIADCSWGTLGSELPGGIAAKLVYPNRQVVVITGDGSLLMAASDLVTAVEEGANILMVVLNDSCYGSIKVLQEIEFGRSYGD